MRIEFGDALSNTNILDILSLIFSIIAIIVSAIIGYVEYSQIRISSIVDLESQYFRDVYSEYLLKKIPTALQQITFPEHRISGSEALQECLTKMRHDSAYFRWTNQDFYQKLKNIMTELEDYVINAHNRTYDLEQQLDFNANVQAKLHTLYTTVTESYHGKTLKRKNFLASSKKRNKSPIISHRE